MSSPTSVPHSIPNQPSLWPRGSVVSWTILLLGFLLRVIALDLKPPHFDEGVNGWFVDQITRQGFYHYDPSNFHGPLHFYLEFISQTLLGRSVTALRIPVVLASTACIGLLLAFRPFFGRRACQLAALAMAISPGMVFYGRYAIHESWLLFFLLLTTWGLLGLWRFGTARHLWALGMGITGMILTKETYAIHLAALLLAFPTLGLLELLSPSIPLPRAPQSWTRRDLQRIVAVSVALIVFFYSGALLDWPDFSHEPGTVGSLAGLWESFEKWTATGVGGQTGHEKPWPYWLELLARYEWPSAAGLLLVPLVVWRSKERLVRYLAIAGTGTLTAYSIVSYKTPWCLIVMAWPFMLLFGYSAVRAWRNIDRITTATVCAVLLCFSLATGLQLNFRNYTDESEPYVYVQTLPDVDKLMNPLRTLTRISPIYFHLRGHILLPENDSHPLSWLLGDYTQVDFLDETQRPADMDADFLLVDDAIVSDVEEHLRDIYYKDPFILRGSWGSSATLYLRRGTFGPLMGQRTPDFEPAEAGATAPVPTEGEAQ